jgi:hypothetical protein
VHFPFTHVLPGAQPSLPHLPAPAGWVQLLKPSPQQAKLSPPVLVQAWWLVALQDPPQ